MSQPNLTLAKKLNVVAWILSAIVLLVVGGMRQIKIDTDIDFSFLPGSSTMYLPSYGLFRNVFIILCDLSYHNT